MTVGLPRRAVPHVVPKALAALAALAAASACGGEGEGDGGDPRPDTAAAVQAPDESAGVAELPGGGPPAAPADSAAPPVGGGQPVPAESLPPLPGEEPPVELATYRLLLVNSNADSAVVHASAGAGPVVLDTVPGRDSVRVDVRLRSEAIRLEAVTPGGEPLGGVEILLEADSLNRWEVPRKAARGVAIPGRPGRPPRWGPAA